MATDGTRRTHPLDPPALTMDEISRREVDAYTDIVMDILHSDKSDDDKRTQVRSLMEWLA